MAKTIAYTVGQTSAAKEQQKAALQAQFPEAAKIYSEAWGRNGTKAAPSRQTRGHALMAVTAGDVFVTDRIERLGAHKKEALAICGGLLEEGVAVVAIDDGIDTRQGPAGLKTLLGKISKNAMRQALADARAKGAKTRHFRLTAEQQAAVLALLKDGKVPAKVSRELGIGETRIRELARIGGLKIDKRFRNGVQGRVLGQEDQKTIAKRIADGEKPPAIAKDLGVHVASIYRVKRIADGKQKLRRNESGTA